MHALLRARILEGSSGAPLRSTKRVGNSRLTADYGIGNAAYCKFPFKSKFNYKTYTTCTRSENPDLSGREVGSGWCATEVDEFGFAVREKHGLCLEERCDVQDDAVRGGDGTGGGRGRSALEFDRCQE